MVMTAKSEILHIIEPNRHIMEPFIDFVKDNFDIDHHLFYLLGSDVSRGDMSDKYDMVCRYSKYRLPHLIHAMNVARKIIIHGLFNLRINELLLLQPWLFKKTYWVMWGGDFYFPEKQPWIRKCTIKKIQNCITGNIGDYEYLVKNYFSCAKRWDSFMYPSNLFKSAQYQNDESIHKETNILVGNSADPSNNHIEVLKKLTDLKGYKIKIYIPLSYGDETYRERIIAKGKDIFGDKFIPIVELMPFTEYIHFLSKIDIGLFNHNRQQAFGTIITLLGFGTNVFLKKNVTTYSLLKEYGLTIFDIDNDFSIRKRDCSQNVVIVKTIFSEHTLKKQLECIFS